MKPVSPLISADELSALMQSEESIIVVDASWHLPNVQRNAFDEYINERIPGAVFFDIDAVADKQTDLPHMLPSEAEFSTTMKTLGISADDTVVVYDSVGLFSAARVWWTFKVFGHSHVRLLDGGLPGWKALGYATEAGDVTRNTSSQRFAAKLNAEAVCDWQSVLSAIDKNSAYILDARPKARFDAAVPEPREGLRSGHMPGAISLPFTELLTAGNDDVMRLKPAAELAAIFKAKGVAEGEGHAVITTCGSGVTAAVITLALELAGYAPGRLYDGSWTEWGGRTDTPVAS